MGTNRLVAAAIGGCIFGEAGTGYRWHHTKDTAGAVEGTDDYNITGKSDWRISRCPLTEFNEKDWYSLVKFAMLYGREDIRFIFKNGMEIRT